MKKFLDVNHPFFVPRWRRIAVVVVCGLWALAEWLAASPLWAILASGLTAYTLYALILTFDAARAAQGERED